MFKARFLLCGVMLGLIFLSFGCSQVSAQKQDFGKATDFELQHSNGDYVRLSDYAGKSIVLNFFTTTCPTCRAEIPEFNRFQSAHPDVAVIGIMLDARNAQDANFAKERLDIKYTVLVDDGKVSVIYGPIIYVPTAVIIDKDFNIADRYVGPLTERGLEEKVGLGR